jgi:hypothetical protein
MPQLRLLHNVIGFNEGISECAKAARWEFTMFGVYFELPVEHAAVVTLANVMSFNGGWRPCTSMVHATVGASRGLKMGPKWGPAGAQYGCQLGPNEIHNGPQMGPKMRIVTPAQRDQLQGRHQRVRESSPMEGGFELDVRHVAVETPDQRDQLQWRHHRVRESSPVEFTQIGVDFELAVEHAAVEALENVMGLNGGISAMRKQPSELGRFGSSQASALEIAMTLALWVASTGRSFGSSQASALELAVSLALGVAITCSSQASSLELAVSLALGVASTCKSFGSSQASAWELAMTLALRVAST